MPITFEDVRSGGLSAALERVLTDSEAPPEVVAEAKRLNALRGLRALVDPALDLHFTHPGGRTVPEIVATLTTFAEALTALAEAADAVAEVIESNPPVDTKQFVRGKGEVHTRTFPTADGGDA